MFCCTEEKSYSENVKTFSKKTIPKTIGLTGRKFYFDKLRMPFTIFTKGSLLIVGESRRTHAEFPPVHIIDAQNMKYMTSKGILGFGPGGISDVAGIDLGAKENTFWVYSAMEKRFSEFSLDDTVSLSNNQIKQEGDFFMAMAMTWSSNSTVMCRMVNDPYQFVEFNISGLRQQNYGQWKDHLVRKDFTDYMMADLHLGWFRGNQNNNIYVSAGAYRDWIEILDRETGKITMVDGPYNFIPKFTVAKTSGQSDKIIVDINEPLAYWGVDVGDKYIYGLYCGRTDKQLREGDQLATEIYVFDLEGNIQCELRLDTSIRALAVDENSKKIFGITTDEDPGIAVFDLPSLN
ncbi:BF3164 family lipoprotein [Negadavirga shengliensis]|uniref:BF3164 family lipoprotein n=1 Tax=Negadavirga shengliensis TaxID=1389218 RepID=A0ABV9T4R0_9BACT